MYKYIVISFALLFYTLISVFSEEKILTEEVVLGTIILTSYYFFVSRLYLQQKIWTVIFLSLFLLMLSVPQTIVVSAIALFNCFFSYGQASSLLNTSFSESSSMLSSFPIIGAIFIFF